jgi:phosphotransferase system IIB component
LYTFSYIGSGPEKKKKIGGSFFVKKLSKGIKKLQNFVKKLSKSCQKSAKKLLKLCKKVGKNLSKSCYIVTGSGEEEEEEEAEEEEEEDWYSLDQVRLCRIW